VDEARKYRSALQYVHIKDIDARILGEARRKKLNFEQAVGAGVFSRVGRGCIDFDRFFRFLAAGGYSSWAIVEQDVIYGKTAVPPVDSMRDSLTYLKNVLSNLESASQRAEMRP
jgi:inosose dehydratase